MIYGVEIESRLIYEVRPIGDFIMIRPARAGLEHLLSRVTMLEFSKNFDVFLSKFLIPNQLTAEDDDSY